MPGVSKSAVPSQRIGLSIPEGLHSQMMEVILAEKKWVDRADFIRQAILEKVQRWRES
jgi:metal-responsive CopG/Arc/MetJ family transcriptional regulator